MPSAVLGGFSDSFVKTFGNQVIVVGSGTSFVLDARGMSIVTVITGAASTATVSRVDSDGAVADSGDVAANQSVAIATRLNITVDWPFYRVTAATGSVRLACV
jgi:hypothetical protein